MNRLNRGDLVVVVADTLPMQMEQLAAGLSAGNVGQRPFEMDYRSLFVLKDLAEGKSVQDPIYTGLDACTQSNHSSCLVQ